MKPNKKRIRKWVEALRSGEYPQTTLTLRDSKGYCCLGVACDVSGIGEWNHGEYGTTYEIEGLHEDECLPKLVADWYGIEVDPRVEIEENEPTPEALTLLNDDYCYDFSKIADCIEETYLEED